MPKAQLINYMAKTLMACYSVNIIGMGIFALLVFVVMFFLRKKFSTIWYKILMYLFLFLFLFHTVHENLSDCVREDVYFTFLPTNWDLMGVVRFVLMRLF